MTFETGSATAKHRYVIRHPPVIGNAALRLRGAFGNRRPPEMDLLEIARSIRLAAGIGEECITRAGTRHRWHRSEPRGEIALQLRIDRMLEPHIGAVRM